MAEKAAEKPTDKPTDKASEDTVGSSSDKKATETKSKDTAVEKFPVDVGVPHISQTLPVPKHLVGYLVGRQGKTLKGIMKGSSTRIYIQENERDPDWSYAHVQGSARAVNRAKKILINAMLRAGTDKTAETKPTAK